MDQKVNEKLTIGGLANGEIADRINAEIDKVVENLANIEADWKARREVTMKLVLTTNEDRTIVSCDATVSSKLAGRPSLSATIALGMDSRGNVIVEEIKSRQAELDLSGSVIGIEEASK